MSYEILVEFPKEPILSFWVKDLHNAEKAYAVEQQLRKRFEAFEGWRIVTYEMEAVLRPVCL